MSEKPASEQTSINASPETPLLGAGGELVRVVTDLVSGVSIPEPIKKSAFKAFNQLCTALIDVPVAHLEGRAAEIREESMARRKLIATTSDQIAAQISVAPEMAQIAVAKHGAKILREQVNLDRISSIAATQLKAEALKVAQIPNEQAERGEITDDWLNSFQNQAAEKSSEEMQLLFGRILAGEIARPGSFSVRTVKLISQLDESTAKLFRRLCSLAVSLQFGKNSFDSRVPALGGNAASNALQKFGLDFDKLNILHEYGLIIAEYNSNMNYELSCIREGNFAIPFRFQNKLWALNSDAPRQVGQELRLHGVALTHSGKELMQIVDIVLDERFSADLHAFFKAQGLTMTPVVML
jgi:Protein of unknown function (DUF2806)